MITRGRHFRWLRRGPGSPGCTRSSRGDRRRSRAQVPSPGSSSPPLQRPPATPTAEPFPGKRVPEAPRPAPDATPLRPLRKLSRFWRAGAETCSSCRGPRRATKGSFTVRPTCHLTVWSGHRFLGSLLTHPHPPCTGDGFRCLPGHLSSPEHNNPCGQNRARPRCVNMMNRPRSELA